jgi:hypothetical protein
VRITLGRNRCDIPLNRNPQEQLAKERQIAFRNPVQQSVQVATIDAHSLKISWIQDTARGISNPQCAAAKPRQNWLDGALTDAAAWLEE